MGKIREKGVREAIGEYAKRLGRYCRFEIVEVSDEKALSDSVSRCLTDTEFSETLARNGQQVILDHQGATQKSVRLLGTLLKQK